MWHNMLAVVSALEVIPACHGGAKGCSMLAGQLGRQNSVAQHVQGSSSANHTSGTTLKIVSRQPGISPAVRAFCCC